MTISPNEKVTVAVTKDGKQYGYSAGEAITEEGFYTATITDAYGNSKTISFLIVSPEAKTSIDYELGKGCDIVSVTKDGKEVETTGNRIRFHEDGTYVITYTKDGKTYSVTLRLDTTAPEITLNGVEDRGTVDGTVTIDSMSEEGTIEVYKDGKKIDYELGQELKEYGSYEVVVTDKLGNSRTYSFTLKFQMNAWAITLIVLGLATAVGVAATIVMKRKRLFKKYKRRRLRLLEEFKWRDQSDFRFDPGEESGIVDFSGSQTEKFINHLLIAYFEMHFICIQT